MAPIINPIELLSSLEPSQILARLDELNREQKALRVLLRAARARCRKEHSRATQANLPEVTRHAS
jgi:hypothetical protein